MAQTNKSNYKQIRLQDMIFSFTILNKQIANIPVNVDLEVFTEWHKTYWPKDTTKQAFNRFGIRMYYKLCSKHRPKPE